MKKILLLAIKSYQWVLSPLLGKHCRFTPTCSVYAWQAIERFGCVRGIGLAAHRILRCHPFHAGGYDPVPDKNEVK
jgi:putative membrane protein insertion efficiency factor